MIRELQTRLVVPPDHPSLEGHFPGRPIVPGVVLLEAMLDAMRAALPRPRTLESIVSAKFLQRVEPGMLIDLQISFATQPDGRLKARFLASHSAAPVLEGSCLLSSEGQHA